MGSASVTYSPDALASLRESDSLHLDATRSPETWRIYAAALDSFPGHLRANGMPPTAGAVRREHVESRMSVPRERRSPPRNRSVMGRLSVRSQNQNGQ